jgi:hypothetical protein
MTSCDVLKPKELAREDSSVAARGPSLFDRDQFADALQRLRVEVGRDVQALELRVTRDRLTLQAASVTHRDRIDQYECVSDRVIGPTPVELKGSGELSENLFELSEVNLDSIPPLVKNAVREVDPQDGKPDQVVVRRDLPFSDDVRIRVFVSSPRMPGYLDADEKGEPIADNGGKRSRAKLQKAPQR